MARLEQLVDDAILTIGSSSAIFACGAARRGLRVAFIGKVGEDQFGHFMVDAGPTARGIDVTGVVHDRTLKTGLTVILSPWSGSGYVDLIPGAIVPRYEKRSTWPWYAARAIFTWGATICWMRCRPAGFPFVCGSPGGLGLSVSLDTNYDPTEQWAGQIETTLTHVDIFLPNETELTAIAQNPDWRQALESLAWRVPIVAVKRGQAGAAARHGTVVVTVAPRPLSAVDTTGAGDSFDAGFVYGYLAGWGAPSVRCNWQRPAARFFYSVVAGGTVAQPTLVEALSFMEQLEH